MRFKKIKVNKDDKIHIEYEIKNQGAIDEYSFTSAEKARPDFHTALQALAWDVEELCEFKPGSHERIFVKGVSFSYGGDTEVMGAVITAQMKLDNSNSPLNLNTPHKASGPYGEGKADPKQLLEEDCVTRLYDLQSEAKHYIKGIRAQGSLFLEKKEGEE